MLHTRRCKTLPMVLPLLLRAQHEQQQGHQTRIQRSSRLRRGDRTVEGARRRPCFCEETRWRPRYKRVEKKATTVAVVVVVVGPAPGLFLHDRWRPVLPVVQGGGGWPRGTSRPGRSEGLLERPPGPGRGWKKPGWAERGSSSKRHRGGAGLENHMLGTGLKRGPRLTWRPAEEQADLEVPRVRGRGAAG